MHIFMLNVKYNYGLSVSFAERSKKFFASAIQFEHYIFTMQMSIDDGSTKLIPFLLSALCVISLNQSNPMHLTVNYTYIWQKKVPLHMHKHTHRQWVTIICIVALATCGIVEKWQRANRSSIKWKYYFMLLTFVSLIILLLSSIICGIVHCTVHQRWPLNQPDDASGTWEAKKN